MAKDNPDFRQASFAAGEWSPLMYARSDYKKFPMALRKCLNWIITQQGALINRPGTQFLSPCKFAAKTARLVPFNFSNDQNIVMEFGEQYIRFYQNANTIISGGFPVEVATPYLAADLPKLKFAQSGDVVTITHRSYPPMDLKRLNTAGTSWSIAASPLRTAPTKPFIVWITNWAAGWATATAKSWKYGISAMYADGSESLITETEEILVDRTANAPVINWMMLGNPAAPEGEPVGYNIYLGRGNSWGLLDYVEKADSRSSSGGTTSSGGFYTDTTLATDKAPVTPTRFSWTGPGSAIGIPFTAGSNVVNAPDFSTAPPDGQAPFAGVPAAWQAGTVYLPGDRVLSNGNTYECVRGGVSMFSFLGTATGPSGTSGAIVDGATSTAFGSRDRVKNAAYVLNACYVYNGATWACVTPGTTANVDYPIAPGTLAANFVGSGFHWRLAGMSLTDGTAVFNLISPYKPVVWKFVQVGAAVSNYPAVCTYHQQRKIFADTLAAPTRIVASRVGQFDSFDVQPAPLPNDAIDVQIASERYEEIRSFVNLRQLLVLTSEKDWTFVGQNGSLTPSTSVAQPNNVRGAAWIDPLVVGTTGLYVQALGSQIWELNFDFYTQSYLGIDVTVEAGHLFQRHQITGWGYAPVPYSVVWAVRDDGVLLGMTHVREQEIRAWHRHSTPNGAFESVCCVPETVDGISETGVYVIVRRVINGTTLRYVERFSTRQLPIVGYVDDYPVLDTTKGVFLDCSIVATGWVITFLGHLEGQQVMALVDGNVAGPYTVTGGKIDLTADFPDGPPTTVLVGLAYNSDAESLDLIPSNIEIRSSMKNVYRSSFEVADTRGMSIGPDLSHLTTWDQRQVTDGFNPVALFTGLEHLRIASRYDHGGRLVFRHSDPLPATLLAFGRETNVGGD